MTVKIIQAEPKDIRPEPVWRKDCPKALALIASTAGINIVLTSIGPVVQYMESYESMDKWFEPFEFEDGIHTVEFLLDSWETCSYDGSYYEEELVIVADRPATAEEVRSHRDYEWPWDPSLWMENWPAVRDWVPANDPF